MNRLKKLLLVVFSCVLTVSSLAFIAACGSDDDSTTKKTTSADDAILGAWYAQGWDSGSVDLQNLNFYMQIKLYDNIDTGYQADIKSRYWDTRVSSLAGAAYFQQTKTIHLTTAKTVLKDNQFIINAYFGYGNNVGAYVDWILTLSDSNVLIVKQLSGEGETITFTRATMTLTEFDAIDVSPQQ